MTEPNVAPDAAPIDPAVEAALADSRDARIESLLEIARIPSVSALHEHAPRHGGDGRVDRGPAPPAGGDRGRSHRDRLHPIVYGRIHEAPGAPTVIVYCHYDVQPVDPLDLWEHPPFEPFVRDGRFIGRGVADDKGQLVMHLGALEALRAAGRAPAVNLTFVFEGEEEYGSESLEAWIAGHRDRLAADAVVISDTGFFEGNVPAITIGLRGLMYAQIDVELSPVDLHSGMYGGAVHNPANALAEIIASLKGADGRVRIPGFYDDVVPLTPAEREAIAALPFDDEAFRAAIPVPSLVGEAGWSTLERKTARPTLDVNGMWSGFQGEGAKTIIPAHAHAKVSARLVANQDPERVFEALRDHVAAVAPAGVTVTIRSLHGGKPSLTPSDHPATLAAARALEPCTASSPCSSARGARSRSPPCSSTTSACRWCCSGSPSPRATPTRRTSGSWSRTSSAGRASSCACGTSSRPVSKPA